MIRNLTKQAEEVSYSGHWNVVGNNKMMNQCQGKGGVNRPPLAGRKVALDATIQWTEKD